MSKQAMLIIVAASAAAMIAMAPVLALRFDLDTGIGFIGKGELQSALGLSNQEFQTGITDSSQGRDDGINSITLLAQVVWDIDCSEGDDLNNYQEQISAFLNYKLITNPQGQVAGIELAGYSEFDSLDDWLEGGPGSVCNDGTELSWEATSFEPELIEISTHRLGTVWLPV